MRYHVLVGCSVICFIALLVYLFYERGGVSQDQVALKFFHALKTDYKKAASVCREETPFFTGGENGRWYYRRSCLLYVACEAKPVNYKEAVEICRSIDAVAYEEGDDNITASGCIRYIDNNC